MRQVLFSAMVGVVASLSFAAAQAADVLSQDDVAHVLTVTTSSGQKTVEIAAKGDARNICDGCTIALENGQFVEPKAGDIVILMDGKLAVHED